MQAGLTACGRRDSEGASGPEVAVEEGAGRSEPGRVPATDSVRRAPLVTECDACGSGMQSMGHCKWLCRRCGFLRTCIDTV